MTLNVALVTGGRADWGLLRRPAEALRDHRNIRLSIVATGQHLGPDGTAGAIEADGFAIAERVALDLSSDTPLAVAHAMGAATGGLAEALARLSPDLMLVLGDRWEILAAVSAALVLRLPVAHIAGGDVTEGAIDDAIRHAVTKMAHLHFVTNADAARRLRQMGEDPARIHVAGSPGIDNILATQRLGRTEFFAAVGLEPRARNLVVTFHPVTLAADSRTQLGELFAALSDLGPDTGLIFTGVNADPEGRTLDADIAMFCQTHENAVRRGSLGARLYYSALTHCDAVVGNSSSGLYEAPSFHKPTINIGDRQKGRLKAASVIDCAAQREAIRAAIEKAYTLDLAKIVNPYGDGQASQRIAAIIAGLKDPRALLTKSFHANTADT